jgi:hypothetical protein
MAGNESPLLVLELPVIGRTVEKAVVSWWRVLVSVIPAWPMGKAMNSTLPQYRRRASSRGAYFEVFSSSFSMHPRSLQKPISMIMSVHCFLSKEVGFGDGESGTPLA